MGKKKQKRSVLSDRARAALQRTAAARVQLAEDIIQEMPTGWQPREYELTAVSELIDLLQEKERVIAVGPTGCGKTVIASMLIAARKRWRVLFVVHRYELADQAYKTLQTNGIKAGIIMDQEYRVHGFHRTDRSARVQVASVQTLVRRPALDDIDLIVFDEAHRVMAKSYLQIAKAHDSAAVLGLTATPERSDGKGLGEFFHDMYIIARPGELQRAKYLAEPRWFGARSEVVAQLAERLRGARVSDGDFAPGDLARAVDSKFLLGNVVSESLRIAPKVGKAVFAGSVKHSQQLAAAFKGRGIAAEHLDADTPPKEREEMLARFAAREFEVLCNFDVLSEGWDLPDLGAVVLARPFRSLGKYLQVVGRGMRWREGPRPIVIDHGNNAPRLGVWPGDDVEWSLVSKGRRTGEAPWKQCESCLERIPAAAVVCGSCGHACPIERAKREREEAEANLEEATRAEYMALRARVEKVAVAKGAPAGWVEKVMREAAHLR